MIIAVDPGIGTGVCVFGEDKSLWYADVLIGRGTSWEKKLDSLCAEVTAYCKLISQLGNLDLALLEYPTFMGGSKGLASARGGNLVKLSYTCGRIHQVLQKHCEKVKLVPVNTWKGQLPKAIVNKRVQAMLSKKEIYELSKNRSHDWDAAGIGLWYLKRKRKVG